MSKVIVTTTFPPVATATTATPPTTTDSGTAAQATPVEPQAASGEHEGCSPTFEELQRCDWGVHVTVRGQPARFNAAGLLGTQRMVIVLGDRTNRTLASECLRLQSVSELEHAYWFIYDRAQLRVGTPPGAPMLPEQAAACLRAGDVIMVNGVAGHYIGMELCDDDLVLMLSVGKEGDASGGATWSVKWRPGLQVRLVSARLPTFEELRRLRGGTPVTIGNHGAPGKLFCTTQRERTRRFVLVQAPSWLRLREAECQPSVRDGEWIYRIRYEEAGLRLVD